jgi:4-hydroxyphenylpyruvate dioxygenase
VDDLHIRRIHHVEMWVGNGTQASHFYRDAFGFSQIARQGLETGVRDRQSRVLGEGNVRLVLSAPLEDRGPIAEFVRRHGDGVRDVAFEVGDAAAAFETAVARGAQPAAEPHELRDDHGSVRIAAIRTFGDNVHSFVEIGDYRGPFLPGYEAHAIAGESAGLLAVDHVVGNVAEGQMNPWARWYSDVLGFAPILSFDDRDISTEYTALRSVVVADESRAVKHPINEPAQGSRPSQIQEYLDYHGGPGVQHLALLTADIVRTTTALRGNGVEFLAVPDAYYEQLESRVGPLDESIDALRALGILVDRDDRGYLLQLFTRPLQDRPTFFIEIIQRKGAQGFGKGNFRALFEAIEREQAARGNLGASS